MKTIEKYGMLIAALRLYICRAKTLMIIANEAGEFTQMHAIVDKKLEAEKLMGHYKRQIEHAQWDGTKLFLYDRFKRTDVGKFKNKKSCKKKN